RAALRLASSLKRRAAESRGTSIHRFRAFWKARRPLARTNTKRNAPVRRSLIGGIAMLECRRRAAGSGRWTVSRWLMVWVVFALFAPPGLRAQAPANTSGVKPDASGSTPTELARFVPKENLICYVEFAGLDSHSEAWNNTAASKMLRDTTLGEMLGLVAG